MEKYYKILGISTTASTNEIKRAYRKRAKELHPDRNKNENAQEQFILLNEAYEYLVAFKTGRLRRTSRVSKASWEKQKEDAKQKARQRAAEYARIRYEEYIKSDHYKSTEAVLVVMEHFYFFSSIGMMIGIPLAGYLIKGIGGLLMGLLIVFMTAPYWAGIFTEKYQINFRGLAKAAVLIAKKRAFQYTLITIINIILFFTFTLYTELSTFAILASLLALYFLTFITGKLTSLHVADERKIYLAFVPTLFNLFFILNNTFSTTPEVETYAFVHNKAWYYHRYHPRLEKISYIELETNKYDENHWFRTFADFEDMKNSRRISYTFERGLFGIRVLKDYEFS